ncbi:hypothetical protein [Acinetobacter baumannii]|uniref:Uncharacterized protein n=1 Tax=Acinetobacter baumannii TaxID=470 RepID=A0AA44XSA8_ACIBA|nr:hypothetical protein [Acinetobacter baumannii]EKA73452.1 hypothetical protein ACINWC692_1303 [Acinetobacter baumannii WC-692]PQL82449.1 hypothetical protein CV954_012810 [Acinetobacter baumannii]
MNELQRIQHECGTNLRRTLDAAIEQAYNSGQSEDIHVLKEQNAEILKHAQEAYEFFKVVTARFCISENRLESTTRTYLAQIGEELLKIKGIKK